MYPEVVSPKEKERKVADLIVEGRWDLSTIANKISDVEREAIFKIPIPRVSRADCWQWIKANDGNYSVKADYKVARKNEEGKVILKPGCSFSTPVVLWKEIWGLMVPPEIKQFLWKVISGAVATKEALFGRKCAKDPICPICMADPEIIEHLLLLFLGHLEYGLVVLLPF